MDRLIEIADVLEVPVEQLLVGEHQTFNFHNSHVEKFYGYIEHLQEDSKEHLKLLANQIEYLQEENKRLLGIIEKSLTSGKKD